MKEAEKAAAKERDYQKLKGEVKELRKLVKEYQIKDMNRALEMQNKNIAHEFLVAALNKEILSLEHRLKEMEEQRLFPEEISEEEKLAYTE